MSQALSTIESGPHEIIERVVLAGDLAKLSTADRLNYYTAVCESLNLNPLTRPFEYITLNGKLTLYARKDATDQLRNLREISISITSREKIEDVYVVTSRATTPGGRTDESTGAVYVGKLAGDALCNAMMKAETKSKRRVTLSICGLGMLDETEAATIPGAVIESTRNAHEELGEAMIAAMDTDETDDSLRQLWAAGGRNPDEFDAYHTKFIAKKTLAQRRQIAQSWEAALKQKTQEGAPTPDAEPAENGDDNGWQIPVQERIHIFDLCVKLTKLGVEENEWRRKLETISGSRSRKALTPDTAAKVAFAFANWVDQLSGDAAVAPKHQKESKARAQ